MFLFYTSLSGTTLVKNGTFTVVLLTMTIQVEIAVSLLFDVVFLL